MKLAACFCLTAAALALASAAFADWVMVDFPHVLAQLGGDVFNGEGWETYDRGEKTPPRPVAAEA
jgi:hypothetical protein